MKHISHYIDTSRVSIECRLCGSTAEEKFRGKILNKYDISYFFCDKCGFLQTEEPYWLDEAYSETISSMDTGIMGRNLRQSRLVTTLIYEFFDRDETFVDYGGGYGIFVRMMRDMGLNFLWHDPYSKNLVARGFEYEGQSNISLITSFETFEHFKNPRLDIERIMKISPNIIFSTVLLPEPIPGPGDWWYYAPASGQHISFYSRRSLEYIAREQGLNLYSAANLHIMTKKKLSRIKLEVFNRANNLMFSLLVGRRAKSKAWSDMETIIRRREGKD